MMFGSKRQKREELNQSHRVVAVSDQPDIPGFRITCSCGGHYTVPGGVQAACVERAMKCHMENVYREHGIDPW